MLADVAQKIQIRNVAVPRGVVHQPRGILFGFKSSSWRAALSRWRCWIQNPPSLATAARRFCRSDRQSNRSRRRPRPIDDGRAMKPAAAPAAGRDCRRAGCPPSVKTAESVSVRRCVWPVPPRRCNQPRRPRHLSRQNISSAEKFRVCGRRAQKEKSDTIRAMIEIASSVRAQCSMPTCWMEFFEG